MASPASRLATNCSLSSITEHSFQGITPSQKTGESVTHVSGTMCYLCLRPLIKPTTYSEEKCRRHPGCVPRDRWFQCPRPTISISLCQLELRGVTLRLHFPHFVAHVAQTGRASAWAA